MKKLLIALLIILNAVCALAQQSKGDAALIQSISVEKAKPEKRSGTWVAGKSVPSSTQTYDAAGNLVESVIYQDGGNIYLKYAAKYDDAGIKTEDTYLDAKGAIRLKTVYQYDANQRLIGKLYFGAKNAPDGEAAVRYKAGRINEIIDYDAKGAVSLRTVYTYYDDKRKIERRYYLPSGFSGGEVVGFDEQGRMTEFITYEMDASSGNLSSFQYDGNGKLSEESLHIGNGTVRWRYSYEVDGHGNWTTQIVSPVSDKPGETNEKPVEITKRTISYRAGASKQVTSPAWSIARFVASEEAGAMLRGSVIKRDRSLPLFPVAGLNGQVYVFLLINELGKVMTAIPYGQLVATMGNGSSDRVRKILEGVVKDWKFEPTVQAGQPIRVSSTVTFNFTSR